jgi:hypothetical protein
MKEPILPALDLAELIEALAQRVSQRILERLPRATDANDPLLLTREQVAKKLGRTVPAVEHLIHEGKLPVVKFDRRTFVDVRDLLRMIDQSKKPGP